MNLRPQWAEGWWALGTLQYDRDQYAEAAHAFEKLVALRPANGSAHAMLGLCEIELKQDPLALQNLLSARKLGVLDDPQLRRVVLYQLGSAQLRARRFADAKSSFSQLVHDGNLSADIADRMGMAALGVTPANLPDNGTPGRDVIDRVGRAECSSAKKDFAGAEHIYSELVAEYPTYPNLHFAYGRFHLDQHELDEAVAEFQRELQSDPNHLGALLEIAAARYRLDSADGIPYAAQAVKINPSLPFAHYLLGLLYIDTDRAADAIPELEIARKAFPAEAGVYFSLGKAYAKVGRTADAAAARAQFARLNAQRPKETGPIFYGEQNRSGLQAADRATDSAERPKP